VCRKHVDGQTIHSLRRCFWRALDGGRGAPRVKRVGTNGTLEGPDKPGASMGPTLSAVAGMRLHPPCPDRLPDFTPGGPGDAPATQGLCCLSPGACHEHEMVPNCSG
jgi:hypothetical protein